MPKVQPCIYCAEKIDQEKQEFVAVPNHPGEMAHMKCYTENNKPGRPSKPTEPGGPYR
jgi:hypothetical protein